MNKIVFFTSISFFLWACSDGNSTGSETYTGDVDTSSSEESSSSIEAPSSEIRSSSSVAPSSLSKAKSSSSSKEKRSSSSKTKLNSADAGEQDSSLPNDVSSSSEQSSSSVTGNSNSTPPYYVEVSPIVVTPITVQPNADKSEFAFSGRAYLDETENTWQTTMPLFTDMELLLAHVNKFNQNEQALIELQYTKPSFPTPAINLAEMGLKISDPEKAQCGTFKLFIVFLASNDPKMNNKFVSVDSIEFVREPEFCLAEQSSSSAAETINPEIELRKFSTSITTLSTTGFSFKDDSDVPLAQAQIQVTENKNGELILHGVNGYKVVKYENANDRKWDDDWSAFELPPSPAHTSDFRFTNAKLADSAIGFDCDAFWIVLGPAFNDNTGDDFYTITLHTKEFPDANGVRELKIIYYKK